MKVLIVKVSALGDIVHALPVLAFLKSADPGITIDWLVEEPFAPLLDGHPLLRNVVKLRTRAWRKSGSATVAGEIWQIVRELRRERYDVVLDLQGNSKSGFFTLLSGAPRRFGFASAAVREWPNLLATNRRVPIGPGEQHISDRSLTIAAAAFPAGTQRLPAGPLPVAEASAAKVERMLRERGIAGRKLIVVHYGTTWATKLWPIECWQRLAASLVQDDRLRLLLTWGGDEEKAAAESICSATRGKAMVWPRGTLADLVALMQAADLVVGGDTGPVHIAAAVGTPTVSLFRVTDGNRNGPRGPRHVRLQSPLDCSPCLRKTCPRDAECGSSISVESVREAVAGLLEEGG